MISGVMEAACKIARVPENKGMVSAGIHQKQFVRARICTKYPDNNFQIAHSTIDSFVPFHLKGKRRGK